MNSTIEKFIMGPFLAVDMTKDSELVREVEEFLQENKVQKYLVRYDRGIEYTEHETRPKFEIKVGELDTLKNLAGKLNMKLTTDRYRRHHYLNIKKEGYDIYAFNMIHDLKPKVKGYR